MGLGLRVDRIEQAELDLHGMLGEERNVHAPAISRHAERIGITWPNAHGVPFRRVWYVWVMRSLMPTSQKKPGNHIYRLLWSFFV
jgi:hypothetical protein